MKSFNSSESKQQFVHFAPNLWIWLFADSKMNCMNQLKSIEVFVFRVSQVIAFVRLFSSPFLQIRCWYLMSEKTFCCACLCVIGRVDLNLWMMKHCILNEDVRHLKERAWHLCFFIKGAANINIVVLIFAINQKKEKHSSLRCSALQIAQTCNARVDV